MSYRTNKDQDFLDKVNSLQEDIMETRREFFKQVGKGAVATAVATTAMHMGVRPYMKPLVSEAAAVPSYGTYTDALAQGGWKNAFSIKPNYTYMNIGTTGSLPIQVLNQFEEWYNEVSETCAAYASNTRYQVETVRGDNFGCKPDELIYSWTTSDGMNKLVYGQDWQNGDVVMTTNMEHIGGLGPMYGMENLFGVKAAPKTVLRWVDANTGATIAALNNNGVARNPKQNDAATVGAVLVAVQQEVVGGVVTQISPVVFAPTGIRRTMVAGYGTDGYGVPGYFNYTQALADWNAPGNLGSNKETFDDFWFEEDYIAANRATNGLPFKNELEQVTNKLNAGGKLRSFVFSSPPYLTGVRFPEKQTCNLLDTLAGNMIRTTLDGAHMPGMLNINLHDMGCDFFAGSGHKWQCGPGQTGLAYIRNGVRGQEGWTLAAGGETRTGTSKAYSTAKALPKFWVQNHSYRRAGYPMAAGKRDNTFNAGDAIMQIGNNSIPMNRAVYETHMLWNTIGRQKIEDYVVYIAQRLRKHLLNAPMFAGLKQWAAGGKAGAIAAGYDYGTMPVFGNQNGVHGLGVDPRIRVKAGFDTNTCPNDDWDAFAEGNGYAMADLLDPGTHRDTFPTASKCGLTPWNPWIYTTVTDSTAAVVNNAFASDYNRPLTFEQSSAENTRSGARLLGRLSDTYGVFTRNTRVPNQIHFNAPVAGVNTTTIYALNNEPNFGVNGASTPLRWSTHLFHTVEEIDKVGSIFTMENMVKDQELANIMTVNEL